MKIIITFLARVFVGRFYIVNAGFLLFIFFVFFGMVNGGQLIAYHQSLILAMISSPVLMVVVWVAWLLYNIKCILFCTGTITSVDSTYIYALRTLPASKQFTVYALISMLQYMPVLAYSVFVVYMAVNRSMVAVAVLVAAYQLLMIALGAAGIYITINNNSIAPVIQKFMSVFSRWKQIRLGYYSFIAAYILYEKKKAFVLVKIFSIVLLSVSFVRNGDNFDDDLFTIFFQVIFAAHAMVVFYCVVFAETQMQFSRNLPVSIYKVAGRYLITYSLLLLPDISFMLINNHGNLPVTGILLLYGTAVSVLFLYTAILYGTALNMDSYMLFVFILFVLIFFLQKAGLQLLTMLGILITAMMVFRTGYYSFEKE